jgi:hypothetical protein
MAGSVGAAFSDGRAGPRAGHFAALQARARVPDTGQGGRGQEEATRAGRFVSDEAEALAELWPESGPSRRFGLYCDAEDPHGS